MLVLFTPVIWSSWSTLQSSVAVFQVIMPLMIIDRNWLQCSECDIRSSFTHFHPAGLLREPASFERFCGWWLTGGNTCLTAVQSGPLLSVCVFTLSQPFFPETDLTGYLTDRTSVVEPCSPGTSPGHIWPPVYIPLSLCAASQSMLRTATKKKKKKSQSVTEITVCVWKIFCHNQMSQILWHVGRALCEHTNITHQHEAWMHTPERLFMHTKQNNCCRCCQCLISKTIYFRTICYVIKIANKTFFYQQIWNQTSGVHFYIEVIFCVPLRLLPRRKMSLIYV